MVSTRSAGWRPFAASALSLGLMATVVGATMLLGGTSHAATSCTSNNGPGKPVLTLSKCTALTDQQTITATGSGYMPAHQIILAECDANAPAGTVCDTATTGPGAFKSVTTDANGHFTASFTVVKSWANADCFASGVQCSLQTVNEAMMSDRSQDAVVDIYFQGQNPSPKPTPSATPTPKQSSSGTKVKLAASQATHLKDPQTITVKGSGYYANTQYFLAECDSNVPAGGACNLQKFKTVNSDSHGKFTQDISVTASWDNAGKQTKCSSAGVKCALQTSDVRNPTDRSQEATLPISFGGAAATTSGPTTPVTGLAWYLPVAATVVLLAGLGGARFARHRMTGQHPES
jgi:hypothetical protein